MMTHVQRVVSNNGEDLLKLGELWAAAGTPNAVFCLDAALIERLTEGKVVAVH